MLIVSRSAAQKKQVVKDLLCNALPVLFKGKEKLLYPTIRCDVGPFSSGEQQPTLALHGDACLGCWEEDSGKSKEQERPVQDGLLDPCPREGSALFCCCFSLQFTNPQEHPEAPYGRGEDLERHLGPSFRPVWGLGGSS